MRRKSDTRFRGAAGRGAGPHRENWPALHGVRLGWGGVVGAGFALPRDAGRRPPPGELASAPRREIGVGRRLVRVSRCRALPVGGPHRENWPASTAGFRVVGAGFAPARCRSEAPTGRTGRRSTACRSVVGAGFALPRDAGRRPPPGELAGAPRREIGVAQRCWCGFRAPHAGRPHRENWPALHGVRLGWRSVVGAGFALPRDAGRRPPPGELAGAPRREIGGAERCWCGFRAAARCRSEAPTGRTGRRSTA